MNIEDIKIKYQERAAIMLEEGRQPIIYAFKEAYNDIKPDLKNLGLKDSEIRLYLKEWRGELV